MPEPDERVAATPRPPGRAATEPGPPPAAPYARRRIAGIEGLRAVAALSIVVFHVWASGPPSERNAPVDLGATGNDAFAWLQSGVTLFFVLSGFLLFAPFASAALTRGSRPSVRQYFVNRGLRILPLYWVVLAFTALTVGRALLTRPGDLLANVFLVQTYVPGLATGTDYHVLGINPAWSLCVEAAFYVLLPALGLLALSASRKLRPVQAVCVPIAIMAVAGIAAAVVAAHVHSTLYNHSLPVHAAWFAVGMTVALVWAAAPERTPLAERWPRRLAVVAIAAIAAISLKLWTSGVLTFEEAQTVTALACGLLLALVVLAPKGSRLLRMLEARPAFAAGLASYGIFLWHEPLLRLLRTQGLTLDGRTGLLVNSVTVIVLTVAISLLTYRLVERPCLALKRNWRSTTPAAALEPTPLTPPPAAGAEAPAGAYAAAP
jgi:peptidoglycan/LPS O-acetylase OafA/YrhL